MSVRSSDEVLMRIALEEAKKGLGLTSPNPAVGSVLAVGDEVIATGYHHHAGAAHAEIDCLAKVCGRLPSGATLYVTLEPCSTAGRTPACTDAIIAQGIKAVVVGATDPNPRHEGRGIDILRAAGVSVRSGVIADACSAINQPFNKWIRTGRPFVIAKCGMTLDGRLTRPAGEPSWITSAAARRHANRRRSLVDAILVGAETIRTDNPRLTVRDNPGAPQPCRVVLTRSGRLPRRSHIFTDSFADRTLVFSDKSPEAVLDELGRREMTSLLVEGGGNVMGQMLDSRLIDAVEIYFGPIFTGGPVVAFPGIGGAATVEGLRLIQPQYERIGDEVFMRAAVMPRERE